MDKCWLKNYQQGVPHEINPDEYDNLLDFFSSSLKNYTNKTAFANMGVNFTYKEIDENSLKLASYLQSLGLKKGSRIAIMMPNLLQYPIAVFGILRAGFTVINVNPLYTFHELQAQLNDSGAELIIGIANFANTIEKALTQANKVKHVIITEVGDCYPLVKRLFVNLFLKHIKHAIPNYANLNYVTFHDALKIGADFKFKAPKISRDDIAFIQYTGGTTGLAKGAVLTHRNIIANVMQTTAWLSALDKNKQQIIVTALPLYHIFSLTANFFTFYKIGAKNILITNPRDTKGFIKQIKKSKFTAITGVNTLFLSLINHPLFPKVDFSELKISLSGGMMLEKKVASHWHKITKSPILEAYGLTETSPGVAINPISTLNYNGSVGLPLPSTEISIRDEHGNELPINSIGELCIKGPQVMHEYWHKDEETKHAFWPDGFIRSGDSARVDENGYLYIVDRIKELIIISGFNVYPHQIEEVILQIPGVKEVAVIAINKGSGQEAVKACVVKENPDITVENIIEYCRENLAAYKIPKVVEFYEELPKSNIGKILKRELS